MKNEFITTLKGDDIEIIGFDLNNSQEITLKEATIKWSIELQFEPWGVRYWREQFESFEITVLIQNEECEIEKRIFDNASMDYELKIDSSNYKMHQDFTITRIEVDRILRTAKAFIQ
jgi:hypothetical protein